MPVYEFQCHECGNRFSALIGMTAEADDKRCPRCMSTKTNRLVSRFVRGRNEDDRLESIADELDRTGESESPSEMRSLVREVGKALDDDMSVEMEEMFEQDMEAGS